MTNLSFPELNEKLVLSRASSSYPTLGTSHNRSGYEIKYANRLVRTDKNYYGSKAEIPEGMRMSKAGEEAAIQLALERAGRHPYRAEVYRDLFPSNYRLEEEAWQWTETGLRVPRGKQNPDRPDYIDPQGRKYWARIVLDGNKEVGEILVPEGNDRLVVEWDEVFGIPRVTIEGTGYIHTPYGYFSFDIKYFLQDEISGHQDVAVIRRSSIPEKGRRGWRLGIDASFLRTWRIGNSYRPVQGSLPMLLRRKGK